MIPTQQLHLFTCCTNEISPSGTVFASFVIAIQFINEIAFFCSFNLKTFRAIWLIGCRLRDKCNISFITTSSAHKSVAYRDKGSAYKIKPVALCLRFYCNLQWMCWYSVLAPGFMVQCSLSKSWMRQNVLLGNSETHRQGASGDQIHNAIFLLN